MTAQIGVSGARKSVTQICQPITTMPTESSIPTEDIKPQSPESIETLVNEATASPGQALFIAFSKAETNKVVLNSQNLLSKVNIACHNIGISPQTQQLALTTDQIISVLNRNNSIAVDLGIDIYEVNKCSEFLTKVRDMLINALSRECVETLEYKRMITKCCGSYPSASSEFREDTPSYNDVMRDVGLDGIIPDPANYFAF